MIAFGHIHAGPHDEDGVYVLEVANATEEVFWSLEVDKDVEVAEGEEVFLELSPLGRVLNLASLETGIPVILRDEQWVFDTNESEDDWVPSVPLSGTLEGRVSELHSKRRTPQGVWEFDVTFETEEGVKARVTLTDIDSSLPLPSKLRIAEGAYDPEHTNVQEFNDLKVVERVEDLVYVEGPQALCGTHIYSYRSDLGAWVGLPPSLSLSPASLGFGIGDREIEGHCIFVDGETFLVRSLQRQVNLYFQLDLPDPSLDSFDYVGRPVTLLWRDSSLVGVQLKGESWKFDNDADPGADAETDVETDEVDSAIHVLQRQLGVDPEALRAFLQTQEGSEAEELEGSEAEELEGSEANPEEELGALDTSPSLLNTVTQAAADSVLARVSGQLSKALV